MGKCEENMIILNLQDEGMWRNMIIPKIKISEGMWREYDYL